MQNFTKGVKNCKILDIETKQKTSAEYISQWVHENASIAMNQAKYEEEYQRRTGEYQQLTDELEKLEQEKLIRKNKVKEAQEALKILKENDSPITEFDESLFFSLIENVTVHSDKTLVFNFKDGSQKEWNIGQR